MIQETWESCRELRSAVRRLLWQWGTMTVRLKRLEREREAFWEMVKDARDTLRSPALTGMPRSGKQMDLSDAIAAIEDAQARYIQQANRIGDEIIEALALKDRISRCVSKLSPIQEKVITYRYFSGYSWDYIAMKLSYDERHARRIEESAVDAIARMIEIHPGAD